MKRKSSARRRTAPAESSGSEIPLRIVGGEFRGRKLAYSGDLRTRPMKDRLREATFNRLGTAVRGKLALDLFAGTGAMGLEALSRGATKALFLELHRPTAEVIERNAATLAVGARTEVIAADTFAWFDRAELPADRPWLVFVCPPYELYRSQPDSMIALVAGLVARAPADSLLVLESDLDWDWTRIPRSSDWDRRPYPPSVIGILEIEPRNP
ncbi:MAG: 23S rRNA (adenine(2030)-N(6))-methyltransferase RlmJ [Pirellulales bacterium]|nr:23S rRNA (adenine(2030)-N(6))-methyltransferase RlmJ [Pirellulales bacterium]